MAMACRAGAAEACRPPMPVAASSVPSAPRNSVRRDACKCVTCGEEKMGARGGRMRFVRFCGNLPQPRGAGGSRIFGTFVALLQARYRLSGSLEGSRSRRISHGESRLKKRAFGRAKTANVRNKGSLGWIIGLHRRGHWVGRSLPLWPLPAYWLRRPYSRHQPHSPRHRLNSRPSSQPSRQHPSRRPRPSRPRHSRAPPINRS